MKNNWLSAMFPEAIRANKEHRYISTYGKQGATGRYRVNFFQKERLYIARQRLHRDFWKVGVKCWDSSQRESVFDARILYARGLDEETARKILQRWERGIRKNYLFRDVPPEYLTFEGQCLAKT